MKLGKILIILAVLVAGFFVFQSFRSVDYVNAPPTAKGDWIAFGDSLTSGIGAGEGQDYPTLLSQRLGWKIHNLGVPGNTTQDGLNRLEDALQMEPRVVLLCLGGNDSLRGVSPEQTFANLSAIIDRFHQAGSFVVLIGVRSASLRDKNSGHFKELAKKKRVFHIADILDGVIGRPALMSDYIHPNEAGYAAIAERLEKELNRVSTKL